MRVLDSHLHLWDPDVLDYEWLAGPLRARFGPEELAGARRAGEEHAAIFVQADCAPEQFLQEVEWVAASADRTGVRGIVAGVRLDRRAETSRDLDRALQHPLVVGVRHLLQGEPDGFAGTDAFRAGIAALAARDLTFDACVRGDAQLRDVAELAAAVPDLRIVLDHLGKPEVGSSAIPIGPSTDWTDALHVLAAHPQVTCKLSGLPAEAGGDWSAAQFEPFFDVALDAFGADRLMFGSDWPVSAVTASDEYRAAEHARWVDAVATWVESRDLDADSIMWRNATRFYAL